jgi:hypothetical protein
MSVNVVCEARESGDGRIDARIRRPSTIRSRGAFFFLSRAAASEIPAESEGRRSVREPDRAMAKAWRPIVCRFDRDGIGARRDVREEE